MEKDWRNIILKHIGAWLILAILSFSLWSMTKPVINGTNIASKNEAVKNEELATESKNTTNKSAITTEMKKNKNLDDESKHSSKNIVNKPEAKPQSETNSNGTTTTTIVNQTDQDQINIDYSIEENPAAISRVEVIVEGLNVREGPSMSSAVIDSIPQGTVVDVYKVENGWLKILTIDGRYGYISASPSLIKTVE